MSLTDSPVSQIALFRGLNAIEIKSVLDLVLFERVTGGEVLSRQYELSNDLFIVLEGTVDVKDAEDRILASFAAGAVLGEVALIDGKPRSASIVASSNGEVARIPGDLFKSLIESEIHLKAKIYENIASMLASRLRAATVRNAGGQVESFEE